MQNKNNARILAWAVERVEQDFAQDVSLLMVYGSYVDGLAHPLSDVDFYYVPATPRAEALAQTFMVAGVGYDLFPMSWERLERIAEFKEQLTPLVAGAQAVYCRSDQDKARLDALRARLKARLADRAFMLERARERCQSAEELFRELLLVRELGRARTYAGYILLSLSDAVAYANQRYFEKGLKRQWEDLQRMPHLPENYLEGYRAVMEADGLAQLLRLTRGLLEAVRSFLARARGEAVCPRQADFAALAGLFQEIVSTFNKIEVSCANGNAVLAYLSGVCLQNALDEAARDNGLPAFPLMEAYDAAHLDRFLARSREAKAQLAHLIVSGGAALDAYENVEAFLASRARRGKGRP